MSLPLYDLRRLKACKLSVLTVWWLLGCGPVTCLPTQLGHTAASWPRVVHSAFAAVLGLVIAIVVTALIRHTGTLDSHSQHHEYHNYRSDPSTS
jgi:hypothetical protein